MKIKIKDIIDFKTDAVKIQKDELHPVMAFLKIEFKDNYCCITKHGMIAFIKKNIPAECKLTDGILFINEESLFNFCEGCKSDDMEINVSSGKVNIISGRRVGELSTLSEDDVFKFPNNDLIPLEWSKVYLETIDAVKIAASFIHSFEDIGAPNIINIFCKGKSVVGCNGHIAYCKTLVDPCPEMIIRKDIAQAISSFPSAEYSSDKSYMYFKSGSLLYAFSKTEVNYFDMSAFGRMDTDRLSFAILKDDIIGFNQFCIKSSKSKIVRAKFNCKTNTQVELVFEEPDSGVYKVFDTIDAPNQGGDFKYDPIVMNTLLNSLPCSMCYFYPGKNKYFITDENKSFITLIMGTI